VSSEKRKAASGLADGPDDVDAALPNSKRSCPQLAAQRRAQFYADKTFSLSDLAHGLIMDRIFSYLDSRALHRVACLTSKSLSEFVTMRHVVHSAVASGGNARASLGRVVGLLKREAIHPPSKVRLLRILNGKSCERGADCAQHAQLRQKMAAEAAAAKNKKKSRANPRAEAGATPLRTRGVQIVRKDFGLFVCNDCTAAGSAKGAKADGKGEEEPPPEQDTGGAQSADGPKPITAKIVRTGNDWFLRQKRLATRQQNYSFSPIILRERFTDSAGEIAGPVLTHTDYLETKDKGKDVDIKDRLKALDDAALRDGFPSASIITYHKEALELFEKRKRESQNESKKKRAALYTKRAEIFEKVVMKKLKERLEGTAWGSVALSYSLSGNADKYTRSSPVAVFKCPIVQEIMKEFTIVPSKADKNNLTVKAIDIMQSFNLIWSSGFHDLSFLDAPADTGDVLCRHLRAFYKDRLKVTPEILLLHERMHPDVLHLIRSGQCLEALYRRFQTIDTVAVFPPSASGGTAIPAWHTRAWCKWTVSPNQCIVSFFIYSAWSIEARALGSVTQNQALRLFHNACYGPFRDLSKKNGSQFEQLWRKQHTSILGKVHRSIAQSNR